MVIYLAEHNVKLDDEDVRAVYVLADYALKYGGLAAHAAVNRLLVKMPQQLDVVDGKKEEDK